MPATSDYNSNTAEMISTGGDLEASKYNAGYVPSYGFVGDLFMNAGGYQDNQRAYVAAKQAELDKQFQIDFDKTKYQRAVKDLEAAGLNKHLAVEGGLGSGSSAAQVSNTNYNGKKANSIAKDIIEFAGKILTFALIKKL